jgi:hypothetical protein
MHTILSRHNPQHWTVQIHGVKTLCLLYHTQPTFSVSLEAKLITVSLLPWGWRWNIPPKHRLHFTGLYGVTFREMEVCLLSHCRLQNVEKSLRMREKDILGPLVTASLFSSRSHLGRFISGHGLRKLPNLNQIRLELLSRIMSYLFWGSFQGPIYSRHRPMT